MKNSNYIVKVGEEDKERLQLQHQTFAMGTEKFLRDIQLSPGMKVLVVGCGAGDETVLIANKVGPAGHVTAIDISVEQVKVAQERMNAERLNNVNVLELAAQRLDELNEQFDIVYARMVLVHVADPIKALSQMLAKVKSGGILACEEPDISTCFTMPKSAAFDKHINLLCEYLRKTGCDPDFGIKLYATFKNFGLRDVSVSFSQPAVIDKLQKNAALLSAKNCGAQYISLNLASESEVAEMIEGIKEEVIDRDDLVMGQCRMSQVFGRKM